MQPVMVTPAGILRRNQGAANAPASPPAPMHPTMRPICADEAPSCRASTISPRVRTCSRMLTAAAKNAL